MGRDQRTGKAWTRTHPNGSIGRRARRTTWKRVSTLECEAAVNHIQRVREDATPLTSS